jgi:hypothetical protein
MTEIKSVPQALRDAAGIYEERNKLYGDNYKRHGEVMNALFPAGVELQDRADHNRFGILTQVVAKLTRYCENFAKGGHPDSLDDMTVYTQMLQELDSEERAALDEATADMFPKEPEASTYTFPVNPIVPGKPLVFDDSELALTAEEPPPPPELLPEAPEGKVVPPTVL